MSGEGAELEGLESFKDFAQKNRAAGFYPGTYDIVMKLYQRRERHGTAAAFVRIGNRCMINRSKFYSLVQQHQ